MILLIVCNKYKKSELKERKIIIVQYTRIVLFVQHSNNKFIKKIIKLLLLLLF